MGKPSPQSLEELRRRIGEKLRQLRKGRSLSQQELAERLELSQGRLSRIENGEASLTAEEFVYVLRIFNVDAAVFTGASDESRSLQNALARFGASHLREDPDVDVLPEHNTPYKAVKAVLLRPSSERLVTALAPVLVLSSQEINLPMLQDELQGSGFTNRLGWLVENVLEGIGSIEIQRSLKLNFLVHVVVRFHHFIVHQKPRVSDESTPLDIFDRGIGSEKSLSYLLRDASNISKKWHIASMIQASDFERALRSALESGS